MWRPLRCLCGVGDWCKNFPSLHSSHIRSLLYFTVYSFFTVYSLELDKVYSQTRLNNGYSSQSVRGQNRYSPLVHRYSIYSSIWSLFLPASDGVPLYDHVQHIIWASIAACLSHVPTSCHIQSCSGRCRARARRPCLMGTASGFIRACSASRALIRLKVQRLVFVRPSARSARKKFIKMFVQSDPDIPAAFAAALRYSLFVRNICYSAELYARSTVTR